jgi:hypothetical protein
VTRREPIRREPTRSQPNRREPTRSVPTRRPTEEPPVRPLYARVLRLRYFQPSGMVCFILLEGTIAAALMLALAELVSWWGLIVLPVVVALLVKAHDVVATVMARSAHAVAQRERDRFQRETRPAMGRATVPGPGASAPAARSSVPVSPTIGWGRTPGGADRPGTVYASSSRSSWPGHDGSDRSDSRDLQPAGPAEQPARRAQQPEWHGGRAESRGQQPDWRGGRPEPRLDPRAWALEQPGQRGERSGWQGMPPGWQSPDRGYG